MLCKHLVQAVPCPSPDWWSMVIQCPTWPFYNICNLLSLQDQAQIPGPEPLGNYVWLKQMHGEEFDSDTPVLSSSLACTVSLGQGKALPGHCQVSSRVHCCSGCLFTSVVPSWCQLGRWYLVLTIFSSEWCRLANLVTCSLCPVYQCCWRPWSF